MKSFLLEIGTEEIPARFLDPALSNLKSIVHNQLTEKRINYEDIKVMGTPRRMAVYVSGLAEMQKSLDVEVKGPAKKAAYDSEGTPTQALLGFARGQGVTPQDVFIKEVGSVEYVFARKSDKGKDTFNILKEIAPLMISSLYFPKPMRWGDSEFRFARPIKWIVALFGSEIVDFEIAGIKADRITQGHRFLNKEIIRLEQPEEYVGKLLKAYVMVDSQERRKTIWSQLEKEIIAIGGLVEKDDELLDEVNNLLEYPTAFIGSFDQDFLRIPQEVLVTVMREHQRYFPVYDSSGKLLPRFAGVRNGTDEHMEIVRAGNERVLRARLADAAFFWDEDLKIPLADKTPKLEDIVWQESLGTVYNKVERIVLLSEIIGRDLLIEEKSFADIKRAAYICKTDLLTNMVYEFTELQGIMGREYAIKSGENPTVAQAIYEHYLPRYADDELPETQVGRILSLADKFDSIVGCFSIGIQPTGSQDPYALRRQALGIISVIIDGKLILSLNKMIASAYMSYERDFELKVSLQTAASELIDFFRQRMRGMLIDRGFSYDIVDAVLAAGNDDLLAVVQRAEALEHFRSEDSFAGFLVAFNRANNLARKYKGNQVLPQLFEHPAEKALYQAIEESRKDVEALQVRRDYFAALQRLSLLRESVDNFFTAVMVMVEEDSVRQNRLSLLNNVALLASPIADFNKIVVSG